MTEERRVRIKCLSDDKEPDAQQEGVVPHKCSPFEDRDLLLSDRTADFDRQSDCLRTVIDCLNDIHTLCNSAVLRDYGIRSVLRSEMSAETAKRLRDISNKNGIVTNRRFTSYRRDSGNILEPLRKELRSTVILLHKVIKNKFNKIRNLCATIDWQYETLIDGLINATQEPSAKRRTDRFFPKTYGFDKQGNILRSDHNISNNDVRDNDVSDSNDVEDNTVNSVDAQLEQDIFSSDFDDLEESQGNAEDTDAAEELARVQRLRAEYPDDFSDDRYSWS
jgi:hypothetical protein